MKACSFSNYLNIAYSTESIRTAKLSYLVIRNEEVKFLIQETVWLREKLSVCGYEYTEGHVYDAEHSMHQHEKFRDTRKKTLDNNNEIREPEMQAVNNV